MQFKLIKSIHVQALFENTYFTFFPISKIHDFLRFFEITYIKKS